MIQLKHNYLKAIYIFVINLAHYFENKSLSHCAMWFDIQHNIISHCIAIAVWEDFVPLQCHNNLISSHLLGGVAFFISLSEDAK